MKIVKFYTDFVGWSLEALLQTSPSSLSPQVMRREVALSDRILTQNFMDMENIQTFREVLHHPKREPEGNKAGSTHHPPPSAWQHDIS